jgi:hypothetical protein
MMVGNKERFGIECHLRHSEKPIIGDLWLWADNRRIGDDISGVDLPLVMSRLSAPLYLAGRRDVVFLRELSKEEVARLFLTLVYGDEQDIPDELARVGLRYFRHVVLCDYCMEGFDSVFVALLGRPEGGDRLIWKNKNADDVYEMVLEDGQYDSVVLATYDWLEDQTGYKSDWTTWLNLTESDKDDLRRAAVKRMPKLVGPDNTESLDEAAFEELSRRRQSDEQSNR